MHVRRAIWPAALVVAIVGIRAQSHAPGVDAYAELQALEAQLLASRSATQTLEAWCRDHRLADTPRIVSRRVDADTRPPTAEQRRRLEVAADEPVRYRRVDLMCGARVLSVADNWYVPSRLTTEMNRLLDTTDTPFGKAVAPLEPSRETFVIKRPAFLRGGRNVPARSVRSMRRGVQ